MVVPQPESPLSSANRTAPQARELYLILFPNGFEEQIEGILGEISVPGCSEGPNLVGRGLRGVPSHGRDSRIVIGPAPNFLPKTRKPRYVDNQVWPGATGEIFTAIETDQAEALMQRLRALDEELQRSSRGLHGLHVLTWPCQRLL